MRKASPIVTTRLVLDLHQCYIAMIEKKYFKQFIDYPSFIIELLGQIPNHNYELYKFQNNSVTSTKIDTIEIRDIFEDFISWELNIPQMKEDNTPNEILLQII